MASITAYEGGRWRAVVRRVGYKVRSQIFDTKRKAETWARKLENEMDEAKYRDPAEGLRVTVRDLMEKFRDEVTALRKGGRWERLRIDLLLRTADFVERRLDQLTSEDIRTWRDARMKQVSGASVNREMNLVSGIFTHAIKEWGIKMPSNPMHLVGRPKNVDRHRNRRWSQEDLDKILVAAKWDINHKPTKGYEYVGWAVQIAIETAMRLGELCTVRVSDLNAQGRYLTLHDSKNNDGRAVPLSRRAVELLEILVKDRPLEAKIFPVASGSLGTYYRTVRKKAGVSNLRFHDTRHEAATRLSKKLTNVLELSAVTGHRSLQSLKRYYNPSATELANKLD